MTILYKLVDRKTRYGTNYCMYINTNNNVNCSSESMSCSCKKIQFNNLLTQFPKLKSFFPKYKKDKIINVPNMFFFNSVEACNNFKNKCQVEFKNTIILEVKPLIYSSNLNEFEFKYHCGSNIENLLIPCKQMLYSSFLKYYTPYRDLYKNSVVFCDSIKVLT